MKCENKIIVYVNPHSNTPIYHHANKNINDMLEFARIVVPEGVHYNIINSDEMANETLPALTNYNCENDESFKSYFEYLAAL